jgi:hypothetical protein
MLDLLQWPAMVVTVIAAWMVASQRKFKRNWGFWLFLLSNVLWIVWGWQDHAYALIVLQVCLAFLNVRGAMKNRKPETNSLTLLRRGAGGVAWFQSKLIDRFACKLSCNSV